MLPLFRALDILHQKASLVGAFIMNPQKSRKGGNLMKDFMEPKLEVLAFSINDVITLSGIIDGEGDGSVGDVTPVIPF